MVIKGMNLGLLKIPFLPAGAIREGTLGLIVVGTDNPVAESYRNVLNFWILAGFCHSLELTV